MINNEKIFLLTIALTVVMAGKAGAQDASPASKRANQQHIPFEGGRDKGMNVAAIYDYLLDSYANFMKVVEAPNNGQYIGGVKSRLKTLYPYLLNGVVYYLEQKQPAKALDSAVTYIDMSQVQLFRSELLPKDNRHASVAYYAAVSASNLERNEQTLRYFQEYLNTGMEAQQKDCYAYTNMTYQKQKKYADQEHILEQVIAKYLVSLDFLYNLVNVHIATNNTERLIGVIGRILAVDPNNDKVLPIKTCTLERQGKNVEAPNIYKRLHAPHPESFESVIGVARANFNCAMEIVNNGATIANDTEYVLIRQRVSGYLTDAKDLFLKILQRDPSSKLYMQGLAGVYQYMDTRPEYEVLSKTVQGGASYIAFSFRLVAYKEALKKTENIAQEQGSVPVLAEPAMLVTKMGQFTDTNNNKVIDTGESFALQFTTENQGKGDTYNIRIRLVEQWGYDQYLDGPRELDGGSVPTGKSKQYTFRYLAKKELPTSLAKINIYTLEANGFDADPSELIVNTQEYVMPCLRIANHQFFVLEGTSITLGKNGKLTIALQNFGAQTARKVKVNSTLPKNIFTIDSPEMIIDNIVPGDVAVLDYGFLVNRRSDEDSVAVTLAVTELTRPTFLNEAYKVKVGNYLSFAASINLSGNVAVREVNMKDFSLSSKSELMEDVPVGAVNRHRYALTIGNEDYSMTGANAEINVPYAVNDAMPFREYCVRTLGVPDGQIKVVPNVTVGTMHEQLDRLVSMASTDPQAELILYYSGHGNNDEATKESYLLPVDTTGKNTCLGIPSSGLYKKLATYSVKGAYVFLDVCFSGGYKSATPLLTQKGVRVVPKVGLLQGNTLSFSSSSGDQTSSVRHKKKQGYYTYFLIKTIRDAKGDLSMKELFERTSVAVKRATALADKIQEPRCMVSPTQVGWENIRSEVPVIEILQ